MLTRVGADYADFLLLIEVENIPSLLHFLFLGRLVIVFIQRINTNVCTVRDDRLRNLIEQVRGDCFRDMARTSTECPRDILRAHIGGSRSGSCVRKLRTQGREGRTPAQPRKQERNAFPGFNSLPARYSTAEFIQLPLSVTVQSVLNSSDDGSTAVSPRTMAYPPTMKISPQIRNPTSHRRTLPGPSGQT